MSTNSLDAQQPAAAPLPAFITFRELAASLRVSRQTIYTMIADGRMPKPFHFGAHAVRFNADEVREAMTRMRLAPPSIKLRVRGKHAEAAGDLL